jgi:anaerobic selenocysteine-containing dehydrogenase
MRSSSQINTGFPQTRNALQLCGEFFTKGSGDPERISEAFRRIPFFVSQAYHIDEHGAFADIVLPDATYVEQPVSYNFEMHRPGRGTLVLSHLTHKPIVEPQNQARAADQVMLDLADRIGILFGQAGLNAMLNRRLGLKPDYALALDKKYKTEEVLDRLLRSTYGDKATFDAIAETGWAIKTVPPEEEYNYFYFPGNKTRHPMYHVNVKKAGEALLAGLKQAGIQHPGLSEEDIKFYYQPIPQWKATPSKRRQQISTSMGSFGKYPVPVRYRRSAKQPIPG